MKILFINLPYKQGYSRNSRSPAVTKSGTLYYPLFLIYAAGFIKKHNYEIKIIDAIADDLNLKNIIKIIENFNPDIIFSELSIPAINEELSILKILKKEFYDKKFVCAGMYPSSNRNDLNKCSFLDAVITGEYENALLKIIKDLEKNNKILSGKGVFSFKDSSNNIGEAQEIDINELPFLGEIVKNQLNIKNYFYASTQYPMMSILCSRGCAYKCIFCPWPNSLFKNHRIRNVDNVIEEFEYIKRVYPEVREIFIEDDTFGIDKEWSIEFCKKLIKNKNRIAFSVNVRVDIDFEILELLKKSGCRLLVAGFESSSDETLEKIGKNITVGQSIKFMKKARGLGFLVHGAFMLGFDWETKQDWINTLNFAIKLSPDTAQFFPVIPYPGTKYYDILKTKQYLNLNNDGNWLTADGLHNTIIKTENFSSEEIVNFCNFCRKKYYLRTKYILYKMKQSYNNPYEWKRNIKAFFKFLPHLLKTK